jgi:hypothetical protein
MFLVRDVLDKQLLDVNRTRMGKVDGVVLGVGSSHPPRVVALETGPVTLLRRLSPRLAVLLERLEKRLGIEDARPLRLGPEQVLRLDIDVQVAVNAQETRAFAWEDWLRRRVVERIPGSGADE